jgi:hypothetical protein
MFTAVELLENGGVIIHHLGLFSIFMRPVIVAPNGEPLVAFSMCLN